MPMTPRRSVTRADRRPLARMRPGLAHRDFGFQQKPRSFHDLRDRALILMQPRLGAGQMDAVLHGQRLVDGLMLQEGGDKEADHVGDHEGNDDGVVLSHLEDDEHRGHGRAHHAGEDRTHAHQRVGPAWPSPAGRDDARRCRPRLPTCAEEERWAEDAAGVARA